MRLNQAVLLEPLLLKCARTRLPRIEQLRAGQRAEDAASRGVLDADVSENVMVGRCGGDRMRNWHESVPSRARQVHDD